MNDLTASELISKSLSGALSAPEQAELERYLAHSPESQALLNLSALIEKSLRDSSRDPALADADDPTVGLSKLSKERIRRAIRAAQRQRRSADGPAAATSATTATATPYATAADSAAELLQVAQAETTYFTSNRLPEGVNETRQTSAQFTLLRKIGQGGLGTVWLARDEKLKRNVAIKELNSHGADSQKLWQRFAREAEITGHLEHPNVVPLYLSGTNPDTGLPFYAMRFLGKQTLADAIREYHIVRRAGNDDPIHLHRLLNAFLDVCQAIAYAHARGVIHRDLKPENVALDSFGQVLVLDWGLAKLDTDGELATRLAMSSNFVADSLVHTLEGDVVGTPLYMAPEQAAGELDVLDERTDVYGLGAILFAILTGAAPHESSYQVSSGQSRLKEILTHIASADTPRPRDGNPSIPRDLEMICLRAMSKERLARHASAQELASDVESWIAGRQRLQTRYEAMRLAGRDLKSRLCVQIRQLAVTAQFMVELPPIRGVQEGPGAGGDIEPGEFGSWKDRLSNVLRALAKTNGTLHALSYCQLLDDRIRELVRIERSLHDVANIRALPQSRLRRSTANIFHKTTMEQFPGECYIDFDLSVVGLTRIIAGVPVFDPLTEEPFGLVMAEAEVGRLVSPELDTSQNRYAVYLVDDKGHILFSNRFQGRTDVALATDEIARWSEISQALAEQGEYTEADRVYYATRLPLPNNRNSLRIVLQVSN